MNAANTKWCALWLLTGGLAIGCAPDGSPVTAAEPVEYTIGIVRIDTHGIVVDDQQDERPWVDATVEVVEGTVQAPAEFEGVAAWRGQAALHLRGNSTADYAKKQYALETRDSNGDDLDVTLLGLPVEEDWVLAAPYSDKTLMRNHLMFAWSRAIGRYAPRTRYVELFLEDGGQTVGLEDYQGVYVLTEKIKRDKNRVDVEKMNPTDTTGPALTGGYLLRRDWLEGDVIETQRYGDELMIEYPKSENLIVEQRSYIEGYLNDFEAALAAGDGGYADFIDVDSFIDHMLMMELSRNVDAYVLSTYMHKPRGGLLAMGPIWDFNGSLGNADYFEAWRAEGWHYENPEFPGDNPNGFRWYDVLLQDAEYQERMALRWAEHRSGAWSDSALMRTIGDAKDMLMSAQTRNFERWPVLGDYVWPNDSGYADRTDYESEIAYLRSWVLDRADWIDRQLLK